MFNPVIAMFNPVMVHVLPVIAHISYINPVIAHVIIIAKLVYYIFNPLIAHVLYIQQKKDWFLHKRECAGLQKIHPHVPTDTMRLVLRLYLLGACSQDSNKDVNALSASIISIHLVTKF